MLYAQKKLQNPPASRRTRSTHVFLMLFAAAATGAGCSARYIRAAGPPAGPAPADSLSRHVIVVSIDGLRPDAIEEYGATTLQRLMREGSYTLSARTIHPSKTLPSHTSMLTSLPPEQHGVLWNNVATADADSVELPNVYSQAPGGLFGRWSSERTVSDVGRYLESARPNLLFVHLTDPDAAGHRAGWMTDAYGRAVLAADSAVDRLIALAEHAYGKGNFSLIVTADHGGHGTNHGSDDPRDVTIPWIAWGKGVKHAGAMESAVQTMDTAATVLWLLAVPEPSNWAGHPVTGAYDAVVAGD
jgi:arylsulfatase A-like enzyme